MSSSLLLFTCLVLIGAGGAWGAWWLRGRREQVAQARLQRQAHELLRGCVHGLRNPLAGVSLLSELAEESEDVEQMREQVRLIRAQAELMNELLARFVDASAIEVGVGGLAVERLELRELLAEALEAAGPRAREKGQVLELEAGDPVPVLADREAVRRILDQILRNALAFSPQDSRVLVACGIEAGRARVRVLDEGPGLAQGDWPRLFQRFARLSARPTGGEASVGLGLYTAKLLAEATGGRLWAENRPEGGACFGLELKT